MSRHRGAALGIRSSSSAVVLDPAIALHTPEWLWLSTGIRAVDHCVEGVCSNEAHVFGDAQALKGLALLASGLPGEAAFAEDPSEPPKNSA
jgi:maleylacetate reductase